MNLINLLSIFVKFVLASCTLERDKKAASCLNKVYSMINFHQMLQQASTNSKIPNV